MSENQELLPCPFCGGEAYNAINCGDDFNEYPFSVECNKCAATTDFYSDDESAVEAWNRRAHPDTLTDEAKLRRSQALDELGALDGELL